MKFKKLLSYVLAAVMVFTTLPLTSLEVYAEPLAYHLAVYTTTTAYYTPSITATGSRIAQETESVYFAISKDGVNYDVLNWGGGVVFAPARFSSYSANSGAAVSDPNNPENEALNRNNSNAVRIRNPLIFHDTGKWPDEPFRIIAKDMAENVGFYEFSSADGVNFYNVNRIVTQEEIEGKYNLNTPTLDKGAISLMHNGENLLEKDPNITLGNSIQITEEQYQYYLNKLTPIYNTGLEPVKTYNSLIGKPITEDTLQNDIPTVTATYSDGSSKPFKIDWSGALDNVDFNTPGTYEITGQVIQTRYLNKLKELNGSNAPDDDPDRINPEFPANVNPETNEVYFDETKFVEGLADPQIFWDEPTGYYYMTGSYFPQIGIDELPGEVLDGSASQYDRVAIRRSKTLAGLQRRIPPTDVMDPDAIGQVTIWKTRNQPYFNNPLDRTTNPTGRNGYRFIWAPQIHRTAYQGPCENPEQCDEAFYANGGTTPCKMGWWIVYFTQSQSATDNYNIHSHCIVLPGHRDPFESALKSGDQVSEWINYRVLPHIATDNQGALLTNAQMQESYPRYYNSLTTAFNLDLDFFTNEVTGKSYLCWTGKPMFLGNGNTDIFLAEMNPAVPWEITTPETRLSFPNYGWERISYQVNEGTTTLQRDGKIFITYSASGTGSEYAIGSLVADASSDLLAYEPGTTDSNGKNGNPANWTKSPFPLLSSRHVDGEEGPGHNSFSKDEDGNDIFVYHARPTSHNYGLCGGAGNPLGDPCRHARIKRVHWAADGTPIINMTYNNELRPENHTVTTEITVTSELPAADLLWYKFDETSGDTVTDSSGRGLDGTVSGTGVSFLGSTINGNYLSLNSENQNDGHILVPNETITDVTDFTISTWVKLDDYDTNMKVFDFGSGSGRRMSFTVSSGANGGYMTYLIKTNTTNNLRVINMPTYFRVGKWTHLAITQSGTNLTIYIDGVPVASRDDMIYNPSSLTSPNSNYIGRSRISYDRYFRGGIDDFRMYSYALTEEQVETLLKQFAPKVTSVEALNIESNIGEAPQLPPLVNATYSDGNTFETTVKWQQPSLLQLNSFKPYTIQGVVAGSPLATANVAAFSSSIDGDLGIKTDIYDNTVDFTVESLTPNEKDVVLISAAYDDSGTLIAVNSKTARATQDVVIRESIALPDDIPTDYIKGFVWTPDNEPLSSVDKELNRELESIEIHGDLSDIRDNITLPKTTANGLNVTWTADPPLITTEDIAVSDYDPMPAGVITRGDSDTPVKLTATVRKGGDSASTTFDLVIKAKPVNSGLDSELDSYLFMGFKNLSGDKQQIYFASSRDGLNWSNFLNQGNPVLESFKGSHGLRDPHIIRSPYGDKFYIVATDLDANPGEWYRYANFGSTAIMIWESTDLINWSEPRLIDIAPPGAGCAWAPETIYDEKTGEYLVHFSAHMNGVNVGGAVGQKSVWLTKTRDFVTFSDPIEFVPTLPDTTTTGVIDTTIIKAGDLYYRYTKDENGNRIYSESAPQLLHTTWTRIDPGNYIRPVEGRSYEGPAIFKINNENKWVLLLDEYSGSGARRYTPFVSTDLSTAVFNNPADGTFQMPQDARACHGVVLPITHAEYQAIMAKWPVD